MQECGNPLLKNIHDGKSSKIFSGAFELGESLTIMGC